MDEEDEAGEEDIVSLIFPDGLEGVEFFKVVLVKSLESKTVVCP